LLSALGKVVADRPPAGPEGVGRELTAESPGGARCPVGVVSRAVGGELRRLDPAVTAVVPCCLGCGAPRWSCASRCIDVGKDPVYAAAATPPMAIAPNAAAAATP
jgi:hypothetical protein